MTIDPNQALAQAYAQLQRGDIAGARAGVAGVLRSFPIAAPALSLAALVELTAVERGSDPAPAHKAFAAALKVAPNDPQLLNNWGNLLNRLGDRPAALAAYARAIAAKPDFADAHANFGIVAQAAGQYEESLAALQQAVRLAPRLARAWTALGLCLRELGNYRGALQGLDQALALDPQSPLALRGRAVVESESGGPEAVTRYYRALERLPDDKPTLLGAAIARHEAGDSPGAVSTLAAAVARFPDWSEGHDALSKLRWQTGVTENFTASYDAALAERPRDNALWLALLGTLSQARAYDVMARRIADARAALGDAPVLDLAEAEAASELGDTARAAPLFARVRDALPDNRSVALAYTRHLLRMRDGAAAAAAIEPFTRATAGFVDQLAWALTETAWRLTGDPRHGWLIDVPTMTRRMTLDLDAGELAAIADYLRGLHKAREHPFDQTLRGGTQTSGTLFLRIHPLIERLRTSIEAGIETYIAGLPAPVAGHPLLGRPRDGFRFTGSWSVRLRSGGNHINHVHPEGWLSSACYIALPASLGAGDRDGWLTLGAPPVELGLTDLAPLGLIEPQVGCLALFPSYLWHGTRPFSDGERLTVAFDALPAAQG